MVRLRARSHVAPTLLRTEQMSRSTARHQVTIVSKNPETRDGLEVYLGRTGVAARSTRALEECLRFAPLTTLAFVLFPDEFRHEDVVATLAALAQKQPAALPVLVTAEPQSFERLTVPDVLIVPRPAWGWTILDAIRAHDERRQTKQLERPRRLRPSR